MQQIFEIYRLIIFVEIIGDCLSQVLKLQEENSDKEVNNMITILNIRCCEIAQINKYVWCPQITDPKGKLLQADISKVRTTEVLGGKTAREIAEQLRINELGGVKNLENIRNPIGPARQNLLP